LLYLTGIAKVAAQVAKLDVIIMDKDPARVDKGIKFIGWLFYYLVNYLSYILESLLEKDLAKGKTTADEKEATRKRISSSTSLSLFNNADIIIEVDDICRYLY
jgi:3-hydroxybutyryl-CoA dehydrogenase